jgi:hypothetical protein
VLYVELIGSAQVERANERKSFDNWIIDDNASNFHAHKHSNKMSMLEKGQIFKSLIKRSTINFASDAEKSVEKCCA